jgi:hypothetical protein
MTWLLNVKFRKAWVPTLIPDLSKQVQGKAEELPSTVAMTQTLKDRIMMDGRIESCFLAAQHRPLKL